MSDDLISRKALLEEIDLNFIIPILKINMREEYKAVLKIREIIMNMPTAFDKEKVIEELDKFTGEECTLHECGIRSERCKPCIAKKAIEIVEKGGIE